MQHGDAASTQSLVPLMALLVPVFFVRMGLMVDVRTMLDRDVIVFALLLHRSRRGWASWPAPSPSRRECPGSPSASA